MMSEAKTKFICDCGEVYSSLAAIESCQILNHGKPCTTDRTDKFEALTRQRDELIAAANTAHDYMLSRGVAKGASALKRVIARIEAEIAEEKKP